MNAVKKNKQLVLFDFDSPLLSRQRFHPHNHLVRIGVWDPSQSLCPFDQGDTFPSCDLFESEVGRIEIDGETVEIDVVDGGHCRILVDVHEGGTSDGPSLSPRQRPNDTAHEDALSHAQVAMNENHFTGPEHARQLGAECFRFLGGTANPAQAIR